MRALPVSPRHAKLQIGARLRAARQANRLTIEQVADATGLTKGFISRVERDETSPSVATLLTLCDVLSLQIGSLFDSAEVELVRHADAPLINLGGTGVEERLMTPRGQSRLQMIHSIVQPGGNGGSELYTINCELETAYVLSGTIDLHFSESSTRLEHGDALTFTGGEPHNWSNPDNSRGAEVIWILAPAPWSGNS
ncbi:helix-turn-helix domain-containing protein [Streptomyces sp. NPDC054766]